MSGVAPWLVGGCAGGEAGEAKGYFWRRQRAFGNGMYRETREKCDYV